MLQSEDCLLHLLDLQLVQSQVQLLGGSVEDQFARGILASAHFEGVLVDLHLFDVLVGLILLLSDFGLLTILCLFSYGRAFVYSDSVQTPRSLHIS